MKMEYSFWMKNRATEIGLNQYGADPTDEEICAFYDELAGRNNFKDVKRDRESLLHYLVETDGIFRPDSAKRSCISYGWI